MCRSVASRGVSVRTASVPAQKTECELPFALLHVRRVAILRKDFPLVDGMGAVRRRAQERHVQRAVLTAVAVNGIGTYRQSVAFVFHADESLCAVFPAVLRELLLAECRLAETDGVFECRGDGEFHHALRLRPLQADVDLQNGGCVGQRVAYHGTGTVIAQSGFEYRAHIAALDTAHGR